jgi:mono/diheme cytochrome c family protein
MRNLIVRSFAAGLVAVFLGACGERPPRTPQEEGRIIYMTKCVVCHNANPNLAGTQGPPIAGSSMELLEARVLTLKYPPGYKPKRTTSAMRAFPELRNKIPDLYAFLQAAEDEQARKQ